MLGVRRLMVGNLEHPCRHARLAAIALRRPPDGQEDLLQRVFYRRRVAIELSPEVAAQAWTQRLIERRERALITLRYRGQPPAQLRLLGIGWRLFGVCEMGAVAIGAALRAFRRRFPHSVSHSVSSRLLRHNHTESYVSRKGEKVQSG